MLQTTVLDNTEFNISLYSDTCYCNRFINKLTIIPDTTQQDYIKILNHYSNIFYSKLYKKYEISNKKLEYQPNIDSNNIIGNINNSTCCIIYQNKQISINELIDINFKNIINLRLSCALYAVIKDDCINIRLRINNINLEEIILSKNNDSIIINNDNPKRKIVQHIFHTYPK